MRRPAGGYWLASYPKSGNTWVRMLLNAHHSGALDINANAGCTEYDCNVYLHRALAPFAIEEVVPETLLFLRHAVLLHLLAGTRHNPTIIKTHNANKCVEEVELIPSAMTLGAVYIVRDPRDVAVSFARHTGQTIDLTIAHMAGINNRLQSENNPVASWLGTWSDHVNSWCDGEPCIVRYEDLLSDTVGQFTRILKAFGIKQDPERIEKAVELCRLDRLMKQEEKSGFVETGKAERFFGQGKGWQLELTPEQVRRIEHDHGEVMKKHGYL